MNRANGIPNSYYTDPGILDQEIELLWGHSWIVVGRQEDIPATGDYFTCAIAAEPLVVVRTPAGHLQAMHNVCAHRGMRLAAGQGNVQRFSCPYHGWTYDLQGQLMGVPYPKCLPTLDKHAVSLTCAQIDIWGGFIFINLDPEAKPLLDSLAGMTKRWEAYGSSWEELREVTRYTYDEPFNWKLFMENATDYYHIPFIHSETLELPPVIENVPKGMHFALTSTTPDEDYKRFFDLIFPNMYFHVGPNKVQLLRVTPIAPDACHIDTILYQTPAQAEEYPIDNPQKHRDLKQILEEDFSICRVLQKQAKSRTFNIVYTAKGLEEGVDHFDKMLMATLHRSKQAHGPSDVNGIAND